MITSTKHDDRCDANCNAEAYVRFMLIPATVNDSNMYLDMCGHHASVYELAMLNGSWVIEIDNRDKINAKPAMSASEG